MASARAKQSRTRRRPTADGAGPTPSGADALESFKAFVAAVPIAAIFSDREQRFVAASSVWLAQSGMTLDQIVGRTPQELWPGHEIHASDMHERCLAGESVSTEPHAVDIPGRGRNWMVLDGAPWRDESGEVAGVLVIRRDVTAEMQAQDEARRARRFLSTVLENTPQALMVKDDQGRFLMMNRATEELFGIGREAMLGVRVSDVRDAEMGGRVAEEDRLAFESTEPVTFEEALVQTRHRGERLLRKTKVVIRSEDEPDYLLVVSEDVTERRKEQDELEQTRAFLANVIDNVPVGLTVKDTSGGRLLISNRAAARLFGLDFGANAGRSHEEVFPPELAARFSAQDAEVIASGEPRLFEEQPIPSSDGLRYLNQRKVLIRNDHGSDYLLSISEDVTERRAAQEALQAALAQAEAANVAKSEFLANMSHEIRTPLNGVLGLADALARMELTPRQAEVVEMIVSSGRALTAILSDVLDLAKAEAGQLELRAEPFSLRETISSAAFLFETVARDKGLDFRVKVDPDGPDRLVGDALRIKQILSNLISNAVKFTARGEIAVSARTLMRKPGEAALEITVRDSGPGFSEEVRAKLFGRFEQGDGSITRKYGGTGLGLSIASTLAQMMDGEIDCAATPGKGATFVFRARMKIDPAIAPVQDDPRKAAAPAGARRVRVLLAEDHAVNQKVVQLMLEGAADLVIVDNGKQAVEACLGPAPFDVVLMDMQMPVMDGLSATRAIRDAERRGGRSRTPIVCLTANAMAHQVQAAISAGADLHLAKPITSEALYAAISQATEGESANGSIAKTG
jgi:PAS domain S-box-containing protein